MRLFDADAHWIELEPDLIRRAGLQRPRVMPSDGWDRTMAGRYSEIRPTDEQRREFFCANGIAAAAMHPTRALSLGLIPEPRVAVRIAEAFHEYALECCAAEPQGACELIPMALAVPQAIHHTVANLGRYREMGFHGVLLLPHGHGRLLGSEEFRELFERCDDLGLAVTLHANSAGADGAQGFERFAEVHCLTFPWELIRQFVSMAMSGVFQRHPGLRVAFLEAGAGWMPYWLARMDEEYALRAPELPLDRPPSEAVRGAKVYVSCNGWEEDLLRTDGLLGGGVVWQSDYPHWDHVGREGAEEIAARLPADRARAVLWENAAELYAMAAEPARHVHAA